MVGLLQSVQKTDIIIIFCSINVVSIIFFPLNLFTVNNSPNIHQTVTLCNCDKKYLKVNFLVIDIIEIWPYWVGRIESMFWCWPYWVFFCFFLHCYSVSNRIVTGDLFFDVKLLTRKAIIFKRNIFFRFCCDVILFVMFFRKCVLFCLMVKMQMGW